MGETNISKEKYMIKESYEQGLKLIYPQREQQWEEFCKNIPERNCEVLKDAVYYMNTIEQGQFICDAYDYARQRYFHDIDNIEFDLLCEIIKMFSKKGPEFQRFALKRKHYKPTAEYIQSLEETEIENRHFEEELANLSI